MSDYPYGAPASQGPEVPTEQRPTPPAPGHMGGDAPQTPPEKPKKKPRTTLKALLVGLLGGLLGLSPEQQQELMSEDGQQRMRENMERFESGLREMLNAAGAQHEGPHPGEAAPGQGLRGYPFFSQN